MYGCGLGQKVLMAYKDQDLSEVLNAGKDEVVTYLERVVF
jgi:hypothetical protein